MGEVNVTLGAIAKKHNSLHDECSESWDIVQNVSNFAGLVWNADFGQFFRNNLGLNVCFSKPILALKPWDWAGQFEYHEPYNRINFFFTFKGAREILFSEIS